MRGCNRSIVGRMYGTHNMVRCTDASVYRCNISWIVKMLLLLELGPSIWGGNNKLEGCMVGTHSA